MAQALARSLPLPFSRHSKSHDGSDEGDEGWCCDVEGRARSCACRSHRSEACRGQEDARSFGGGCHSASQDGQVHHSRPLHDQDAQEACDQGWQEGGFREGDDGEGEACEDCGEGLPSEGIEGRHLGSLFVKACLSSRACMCENFTDAARSACEWTPFQMYFSHVRLAKK